MKFRILKKTAFFLFLVITLTNIPFTFADSGDMNRSVLAPTFVIFEANEPEHYIYAKNPEKKILPASTTKIMTCILALEATENLDEPVTVPAIATRLKSTNTLMGLKAGETLPMRDLLYGMMLPSGNDAAIAVACHISGSVADFAELMNKKAAELGMTATHFTNASGVYNSGHYSNAHDMALLAAYAMQNETFRTIVATPEYTVPANGIRTNELVLVNTNRLMSDPESSSCFYEYAIGCKTGSTEKGGKCLVAAAEKDGVTLIAVLLGVKEGGDKSTRIRRCFTDAKMLFENIYNNMYAFYTPEQLGIGELTTSADISGAGETKELQLSCTLDPASQVSLRSDSFDSIINDPSLLEIRYQLSDKSIQAPIAEGDEVGICTVDYHGRMLFSGVLKAAESVSAFIPTPSPSPTPLPTPESTETPSPAPVLRIFPDGITQNLPVILCVLLFLLLLTAIILFIVFRKQQKDR